VTSRTGWLNSPRFLPGVCARLPRRRTWLMTGMPANVPPGPQQTSTRSLAGTPMRPLLGDFLAAASEHIDVATNGVPQLPAETASAVVKELGRLTTVMARCAGAFAIDDQADPTCPLDAGALAVQDARAALRHAAARTRTAVGTLGHNSDDVRHPTAT